MGLIKFIKSEGVKITVPKIIYIFLFFANISSILYCLDPWGYWGKIHYGSYLIVTTTLHHLFLVEAFLVFSFHLSRVILKGMPSKVWLYISYFFAVMLFLAELAVSIINMKFQLTFNTKEINPKKIHFFRLSVFVVLSFYFICCTILFFHRLIKLWKVRSEKSEKKKAQYKRLMIYTILILSFTLIIMIVHVFFQIDRYFHDQRVDMVLLVNSFFFYTRIFGC